MEVRPASAWVIVCPPAIRYAVETGLQRGKIMSVTSSARILPYVAVTICLAIVPRHAFADAPPNAAAGLKLAQQNCVACHQIAPTSKRGWTDAPAFEAIANRPGSTTETLSATIQKPHMKMLNTGRPVAEANEIAVYIMSLRRR
jgi:cytochrome c